MCIRRGDTHIDLNKEVAERGFEGRNVLVQLKKFQHEGLNLVTTEQRRCLASKPGSPKEIPKTYLESCGKAPLRRFITYSLKKTWFEG